MNLKRIYKRDESGVLLRQESGQAILDYISLGDTGLRAEQNFSTRLVIAAVQEGWMKLAGNTLKVKTHPVELLYTIQRQPGRYCCHCGEKLPDDENGEMARLHIATQHPRTPSPDPEWPAGYAWYKFFACVLDAKQHEQFRRKGSSYAPIKYPVKGE